MKIVLAADHKGFRMKEEIKEWLMKEKSDVTDMGCSSESSCDYPDFALPAAEKVGKGEADLGLLFCHTGEGMVISANKVKGVRAALIFKPEIAALTHEHNGANVLAFPAGYISVEEAKKAVKLWMETNLTEDRHKRRVGKIGKYEKGEK